MDLNEILDSPGLKPPEKRAAAAEALRSGRAKTADIAAMAGASEKKLALLLEAMEEVTRGDPSVSDEGWLAFAEQYIGSASGSLRREASRVAGNVACLYPGSLGGCTAKLLENTESDMTVTRWAAAYALAKIIVIPEYAKSELYGRLIEISENESENGVKNQYLKALKKAAEIRG
jgi:hypothetical protein